MAAVFEMGVQVPILRKMERDVVDKNEPIVPKMIPIPAGAYTVGTSDEQVGWMATHSSVAQRWREKGLFAREQPQHLVRLERFFIARYPATVAEYRLFLADLTYSNPTYWSTAGWQWLQRVGRTQPDHWGNAKWTADERLPVVGVTWFEAQAYCRWLAAKTGRSYRLPAEAEWAAASRGMEGRLYPWGDAFDARRCNCRAAGLGRTATVGRFSPLGDSPFGVAEMVGNVSEWTASLFRPYPILPGDSRDDPQVDGERTIRGGSWFSPTIRARATARGMNDPDFSDVDLGFRVAAGS